MTAVPWTCILPSLQINDQEDLVNLPSVTPPGQLSFRSQVHLPPKPASSPSLSPLEKSHPTDHPLRVLAPGQALKVRARGPRVHTGAKIGKFQHTIRLRKVGTSGRLPAALWVGRAPKQACITAGGCTRCPALECRRELSAYVSPGQCFSKHDLQPAVSQLRVS